VDMGQRVAMEQKYRWATSTVAKVNRDFRVSRLTFAWWKFSNIFVIPIEKLCLCLKAYGLAF